MQERIERKWWRSVGCHMSPSWNLSMSMSTTADEKKLKENIEIRLQLEYAPDFMPIESLLFRGWLDVSLLRKLQNSTQSLAAAFKYVKEAEKYIPTKEDDKFAHVGYGTVVYSFLLWLHESEKDEEEFKKVEQKLLNLLKSGGSGTTGELHPKERVYVHATHAFALSRLGEENLYQSVTLFKTALRRHPNNKYWQFCQAKILFRRYNMQKLATFGYRKKPLSGSLERKFKIVKAILEKIYQAYPNFHWANVYLGNVLFLLNGKATPHCEMLVNEALDHERNNIDIVLVAVRLYKQMKDFKKCFALLQGLEEDFRTTEVYFQLGILYYEQFKKYRSRDEDLLNKSLANIERALEKDSCKFPAMLKQAELYAKYPQLDNNHPEKAKDFYRDVTKKCNEKANRRNTFHATRSMTNPKVATIFNPLKRVNNCYDHFMAIVEADDFAYRNDNGRMTFSREYEEYANKVTDMLHTFSESDDKENDHARIRAKLHLAKCTQILGEFQKSITIYEALLWNEKLEPCDQRDVKFGLAECCYSLGKYAEAKRYVQHSKMNDAQENKLLTDIYTSEARKLQKQMKDKFAKAIDMRNLESCLEMLLANENFCQEFFSVKASVVQILANINVSLKGEDMQVAVKSDPVKTLKMNIKEKCDEILLQPKTLPPLTEPVFKDTFIGLSGLRSALLTFECSLMHDAATSVCSTEEGSARCSEGRCIRQTGESTSWPTDCPPNAKEVLKKVLSLFNQSIVCLQVTLLSSDVQHKPAQNSAQYPILSWTSEDEADELLAFEDLQDLLVVLFPNDFEAYIPPDVFDCLLQIQPRVDKKNIWLEVLSKFVEDLKGDTLPQDTCRYRLGKERVIPQTFCTVHIARKSCEQAEKLVMNVCKGVKNFLMKLKLRKKLFNLETVRSDMIINLIY